MPLLTSRTLIELQKHHEKSGSAATLLTAEFEDPSGYGRIVRDQSGRIERIVEHAEAGTVELNIREVNTSVYCFNSSLLAQALAKVESSNSQNEYYLTDVVELLVQSGHLVTGVIVDDPDEVRGVNTQEQLVECETLLRTRTNLK
jgi:bifunctional UDP-N-acetylglucosamine pyrophosphorylase/glucosamine-1-phosphate N-acetyltransferase